MISRWISRRYCAPELCRDCEADFFSGWKEYLLCSAVAQLVVNNVGGDQSSCFTAAKLCVEANIDHEWSPLVF